MPRQVFHALNMRYKGQPTISVTIDGTSKVSSQQMPSHSVMKNRRMELPEGVIGYVPQVQSTFTGALTTEFEGKYITSLVGKKSVVSFTSPEPNSPSPEQKPFNVVL